MGFRIGPLPSATIAPSSVTCIPVSSIVSSVLPVVKADTVRVVSVWKMVRILLAVHRLAVPYPVSIAIPAFIPGLIVTAIMGWCGTRGQKTDCA